MKRLTKSKYLKVVKRGREFAVYNSIVSGSLLIVDQEALELLEKFSVPTDPEVLSKQYPRVDIVPVIKQYLKANILVQENVDERERIKRDYIIHISNLKEGKSLRGLILEITKNCNFRCTYCFARELSLHGDRLKSSHMSVSIAKKAVGLFIENAIKNEQSEIEIGFMGGEPLMCRKVIREIVYLTTSLVHDKGHRMKIHYSITTNASLVNKEIANFLKEYNIRTSVSLDGPKELNDVCRVYPDGRGAFNDIIKGLKLLVAAGNEVTVLTTLTDKNFDLLNVGFVDFLISLGVKNWGLNLEDMKSMLNRDASGIIQKLIHLTGYALERNLNTAGMWFKPVFNMINQTKSYCKATEGAYISVEPDGKIFSCSRTAKPIGNIAHFNDLFISDKYRSMGSRVIGGLSECCGCEVEGQCLGGCVAINRPEGCRNSCGLTGYNKDACSFTKKIVRTILADGSLKLIE